MNDRIYNILLKKELSKKYGGLVFPERIPLHILLVAE